MGFLSFQPSMLLSMVTISSWNISGSFRLFSSSMERLRLRVIAEAKGAVRCINLVFSFGAFCSVSFSLRWSERELTIVYRQFAI